MDRIRRDSLAHAAEAAAAPSRDREDLLGLQRKIPFPGVRGLRKGVIEGLIMFVPTGTEPVRAERR